MESTTVATAASTGTTSAIPMTSTSTANKHARDDMSTTMTGIPLVDMRPFLEDPRSHEAMVECRKVYLGVCVEVLVCVTCLRLCQLNVDSSRG